MSWDITLAMVIHIHKPFLDKYGLNPSPQHPSVTKTRRECHKGGNEHQGGNANGYGQRYDSLKKNYEHSFLKSFEDRVIV